jgi:uncharacterized protein (TIGR03084 family)
MLTQATDFRDECDVLHAVAAAAPAAAWNEPTQFKGWTFNDIIGHLHIFDVAAGITLDGRDALAAFLRQIFAGRAAGQTLTEFTRHWLAGCGGHDLLARWREYYVQLAGRYHELDPSLRVAWAGPDMSARSLISARQMEVWAHGQALFDSLGVDRAEHDRIRNIVVMGVNTFGWTFVTNGLEVPASKPYLSLTTPSGQAWQWNEPSADNRIEGTAVDFCRVVTQTRNVADTKLRVTGDVATQWMARAQCFAGPAEPPPAPGTRYVRR